ncbi:ATP-binding protein [Shimia sp. R11_0]|uniref:Serine/threonine-protein kinase BtrW n=1 Tax=Shimia marina TaxID=321267 RepID=A0A0P1ER80_9RHOB|nr:ATP-binding protein [Shimia marina]MBO9478137.1 ATP-binding protein [Shimia sp. R11_0]CUH52265.1 Serine/threonine-protein kinase BtrW [Shimia marina]SFE07157.1 serine/threonine-protein kinase RsbW [Shimia marina]
MTNPQADIHIELEGTPQEVRNALETLRHKLTAQEFAACNAGVLEIVLAEVLNNVVEHALAGRQDGQIVIACNYSDHCWFVEVRDNGAQMPENKLPDGQMPDLERDLSDMPEGGFGWGLVRSLAQDIDYQRRATGHNRLSFRVPD